MFAFFSLHFFEIYCVTLSRIIWSNKGIVVCRNLKNKLSVTLSCDHCETCFLQFPVFETSAVRALVYIIDLMMSGRETNFLN